MAPAMKVNTTSSSAALEFSPNIVYWIIILLFVRILFIELLFYYLYDYLFIE